MRPVSNPSKKIAICIYGDITAARQDETYILNFRDGVNFENPDVVNPLLEMAINFLETHKPRRLVADLSNINTCSTSVLAMLTSIRMQMHYKGSQFQLAGITPRVKDALEIVRLHKVFKIFPTLEAAFDQSPTL